MTGEQRARRMLHDRPEEVLGVGQGDLLMTADRLVHFEQRIDGQFTQIDGQFAQIELALSPRLVEAVSRRP